MMPYASMVGKGRNLDLIDAKGWGVIISPLDLRNPGGRRYILDNTAWGTSQLFLAGKRGTPQPDLRRFRRALDLLGPGADAIVVPDIVMGGGGSWAMSRAWLRRLRRHPKLKHVVLLIAVQDGFEPELVERFLGPRVGIFVGGGTEWKVATLGKWARLARSRGAVCHVGRVNSARRIHQCEEEGVHSYDGSCVSRFGVKKMPLLDAARHRRTLLGEIARSA